MGCSKHPHIFAEKMLMELLTAQRQYKLIMQKNNNLKLAKDIRDLKSVVYLKLTTKLTYLYRYREKHQPKANFINT